MVYQLGSFFVGIYFKDLFRGEKNSTQAFIYIYTHIYIKHLLSYNFRKKLKVLQILLYKTYQKKFTI